MSYPNATDTSARTHSIPTDRLSRWIIGGAEHGTRRGHPDHTNSGGFCSCCGVVYPCRASNTDDAPASGAR
jgi:hypothetical protein